MMWAYIEPPLDSGSPFSKEEFIEKYVAEKIKEYDGTIFFCCSSKDWERINTLTRAAQDAGCQVYDGRVLFKEAEPQSLAILSGKKALFVHHSMQEYLSKYLAACPTSDCHLLLYSRRFGNGPSPHMSGFMDFWIEQGVDILDLCNID